MIFGIPLQAFLGQLLVGLINGSFYALLSLGLAVIFGLLRVINFAHGAQYMLGAFVAFLALKFLGVPYWGALVVAPLVVGAVGALIERTLLSRLYDLDHLYGCCSPLASRWRSRAASAGISAPRGSPMRRRRR